MTISVRRVMVHLSACAVLTLTACGDDDGSAHEVPDVQHLPALKASAPALTSPPTIDEVRSAAPRASHSSTQSVQNAAPTIQGAPRTQALAGQAYSFTPSASDRDGDILHFRIRNAPSWATFDPTTGELHGTPAESDIGTYAGIAITATDGADDAILEPFSITVASVANGIIELSWFAPTENTDGTAMTDLAGYKIYWGTDPGALSNMVTIDNPAVVTYVIDNLVPDTYYFVATAVNIEGAESDLSDVTVITIS